MVTIAEMVTDAVLDDAYTWLCRRRAHYPASADIWSFRPRWPLSWKNSRLSSPQCVAGIHLAVPARAPFKFSPHPLKTNPHHEQDSDSDCPRLGPLQKNQNVPFSHLSLTPLGRVW